LNENDLFAELRLQGTFSLTELRYVIYESKGGLTVVGPDADGPGTPEPPLIRRALGDATALPES